MATTGTRSGGAAARTAGDAPAALVCFSHLRWDWVWQRPQHLLARFARHLPVYVVEEPTFLPGDGAADLRLNHDRGVTIVTPLLPAALAGHWGFNDVTNPLIAALLAPRFAELGLAGPDAAGVVAWYYTPMALGGEPDGFRPVLTVFDAMDELAGFRGAPPALRECEAALMAAADLVFAGGPSLYEARKDRHPRVSCFPSGVEAAHFAQAANGVPRPVDLAARPRPVLGFYGVIDERLDLDLLAAVADARPAWTIAMVGPVIKVAEADLPRSPNIVYLGQRNYADLPGYLACFDVAMLPFARNEATRFISPTKTLEYLAGGKPIVSTPIKDVVDLYGRVVAVAATPAEFVAAAERALAEPAADRARRLAAAEALLAEHDWDAIAAAMWAKITDALADRSSRRPAVASLKGARSAAAASPPPATPPDRAAPADPADD